MAAAPQPDPTQQAQPQGAAPTPPTQAPASPIQVMLAKMYTLCNQLAAQYPAMADGLSKAAQGIQEAQTALITQPQPQPTGATPPF